MIIKLDSKIEFCFVNEIIIATYCSFKWSYAWAENLPKPVTIINAYKASCTKMKNKNK